MAEEQQHPEPNEAELAKFQEMLRTEIRKEIETAFKAQPVPDVKPAKAEEDAFKQALKPYIEPDINEAKLAAADARDDVRFYRRNPSALKYEEKIEDLFERCYKAGRPVARQDIYDKIIGQELRENPKDVYARMKADEQAELARAEAAADVGVLGLGKVKADPRFDNFTTKTLEEMEAALDGFAF